MTYHQMLRELDQIPMFGKAAGLDNLSLYLEYLDHPEESLRVIHVAGTNGKGSVSSYIESVLRTAGYSTGLFTSPHLVRINERIRLNFAECNDQDMAEAFARVKKLIGQREELGLQNLTYFEVLFLMGMLIFQKYKPDYCIVETGLGGRLDATVLTRPILCVITSISLDHTAILGDTLAAIAGEKAGIIKENVPVVLLQEKQEAYEVLAGKAREKKAPLYTVAPEEGAILKKSLNYIDFSMENRYYKNGQLRVHSVAPYQMHNAMLAALAVHVLLPDLQDPVIALGLSNMKWEGRMEEVLPGVYVDGAHNPGAMEQIKLAMEEQEKNWTLLFAVCQDKDYHQMISILASIAWHKIIVTHFCNERAADIDEIADEFRRYTPCPVLVCNDFETVLQTLLQEEKPLLCLGSLYLVGEIKAYCKSIRESEDTYD